MHLRTLFPRHFFLRSSGWLGGAIHLVLLAVCGSAGAALTGTFTVNSTWATGFFYTSPTFPFPYPYKKPSCTTMREDDHLPA